MLQDPLYRNTQVSPVRVAAATNQTGNYLNGPTNNGVGATFTYGVGALTVDSVALNLNDYVLLAGQTLAYQNGIYQVINAGSSSISAVLQRRSDYQNIEQIRTGFYVPVSAGTVYAGSFWTLIEPAPQALGVPAVAGANNLVFVQQDESSDVLLPVVNNDLASFNGTNGQIKDSGISAASLAALLAGSGGAGASSVRSASIAGSFPTASTVITDAAVLAASVVIARFVSSANVVTVQTVLPAAGQFTVVTDTAPSTGVLEYISFTPSAALLAAGVVVGKGAYGGGSATFVIADANITAGMVVTTNFQSQVTPSKVYTALCGAGTITFVCTANPGVCVIEYAAMLPGDIAPLGLHAANYSYAGGFASIAISDASITASSIVTAEFKSQAVPALIQKVTPSAGLLTVLASIDPGVSEVAYIATAAAGGGGSGSSTTPQTTTLSSASATPGTSRAITGANANANATMTTGNLVGTRGAVTVVGASGGFLYGTQGKVIATGTLSGSLWAAGLFGQLDMSAATINAGQVSAIWADWGTTVGTATNMTGTSLFKGTNTTTRVLNSQIWLDGGATNLLQLSGAGNPITYVSSGGAGTLSGTIDKLAISIEGVTFYIPCATVIS